MTYNPKYLNNKTKQELEDEFSKLLKKNVSKALKKEAFRQNSSSTRANFKTANSNKNTKKQNNINSYKEHTNSNTKNNSTYQNLKAPTILKSASYQKKQSSIYSLMQYIFKNTDELENEQGNTILLDKITKESKRFKLLKDSENQKANAVGNKTLEDNLSKRQTAHLIFSLPNNLEDNEELLKDVLRQTLPEVFAGHKYAFGVHKNTNNMHVHIALKYKNDLTNKQLRLDGKKLLEINKLLYDNCKKAQLNLEKTNPKAIKKKKYHYPDYFYKKVPNFIELENFNSLESLKASKNTIDKLKDIGLDKENINRFLNLYQEDNKLAISTLNNNPNFFKVKKKQIEDYKQKHNLKHISFRKLNIIKIDDITKHENIKHEQ